MALPAELARGFKVLLIDAQNDFSNAPMPDYEGRADDHMGIRIPDGTLIGRLPVNNANKDMERIAKFLQNYSGNITKVHASMDTHTIGHIGHMFWRKKI